ncbi:Stf0 family sulfotransferase [Salegentibacter sp. UBA1130]|uniref:Stf0 family sulfotransferase n=1 Tax=Salegentibacter sp. UBA1130 TaxID=1947451 RepID=UPI0025799C79|nr:Stf0 family sulfotransferase [Salegentibacter sp. UBA1130]
MGIYKFYEYSFGSRNYKKFVIIAAPRTGSNWLVSLLNSHPEITCEGEKYKNIKGQSTLKIWNKIFSRRSKRNKYVGFKLLYNQPPDHQDKSIWEIIKNDQDIFIIHLKRNNLLASYVSLQIGYKTGIWKENEGTKTLEEKKHTKVINIDPEDCESYFSLVTDYWKEVSESYEEHPYIEIFYEDLVKDKQGTINEVFNAMHLDAHNVSSDMEKQNKESLEDLIEYYEELKRYFKETKWHYLFQNSQPQKSNN